jgi:hypothetical protein
MNPKDFDKLLKKMRAQIVVGDYEFPLRPKFNVDQNVLWDRLLNGIQELYNNGICDGNCSQCREEFKDVIQYLIDQIDKYRANEYKNAYPTIFLQYQSIETPFGVSVFIYKNKNGLTAWCADKHIQSAVQNYLDSHPSETDMFKLYIDPIDGYEIVDTQRLMLYSFELADEVEQRRKFDAEQPKHAPC